MARKRSSTNAAADAQVALVDDPAPTSSKPKRTRKAQGPKKKRKKAAKAKRQPPRPKPTRKPRARATGKAPRAQRRQIDRPMPVAADEAQEDKPLDLRVIAETLEPKVLTEPEEAEEPLEAKSTERPAEAGEGVEDSKVVAEDVSEDTTAYIAAMVAETVSDSATETALEPDAAAARAPAIEAPSEPCPPPTPEGEAVDLGQCREESPAEEDPEESLSEGVPDSGSLDEGPVELSPEEAIELLTRLSSSEPEQAEERPAGESALGRGTVEPVHVPACRVLTFESPEVDSGMRVAGSTLARLYGMARDEGLDIELGPICQTLEEFVAAWDETPPGTPVAILANLNSAGEFLSGVTAERPGVTSAFWIVFETLRSRFSSARSDFLAELREGNRLRAIGYGPRNIVEAARRGGEAMRGHVEWGFGRVQGSCLHDAGRRQRGRVAS